VIVLADRSWHQGVAGPRPARSLKPISEASSCWRPMVSRNGKVPGAAPMVTIWETGLAPRKRSAWCSERRACSRSGLAVTPAQLFALQTAGLCLPMPLADREALQEDIGQIDQLRPEEWTAALELLATFGRGNPYPVIRAPGARLQSDPVTLLAKDTGQPWAIRAEFKMDSGRRFTALWRDVDAAKKQ